MCSFRGKIKYKTYITLMINTDQGGSWKGFAGEYLNQRGKH